MNSRHNNQIQNYTPWVQNLHTKNINREMYSYIAAYYEREQIPFAEKACFHGSFSVVPLISKTKSPRMNLFVSNFYVNLIVFCFQRGKFRPRLTELVQQNSEKDVESISKAAFKAEKNPEKAVKELSKLKAVGPATASGTYLHSRMFQF